jgi:hypothetical protein
LSRQGVIEKYIRSRCLGCSIRFSSYDVLGTIVTDLSKCKSIHTERTSAEKWYESASNSILIAPQTFPLNIANRFVPSWKELTLMVNAMWGKLCGKNVSVLDAK